MKSLNASRPYSGLFLTVFASLFLVSSSFGQESSAQTLYKIDELNQKIKKNDSKIETFERGLSILNNAEASIASSSTINRKKLEEAIEHINAAATTEVSKIELALDEINFQMTKGGLDFYQLLEQYDQAPEGTTDITIFLSNISKKFRDHYIYPNFIRYEFVNDTRKPVLDTARFSAYKEGLNINNLVEHHAELMKSITGPITTKKKEITTNIQTLEKENKENRQKVLQLQIDLDDQSSIDKTVIYMGFPIFILFILAIYLVPLWYVYKRENLDGQRTENLYKMIYGSGLVTEIITVFLLTSTILLLGVTDKLAPEILGTLIGGISGYVLGRSFNNVDTAKLKLSNEANQNNQNS